MKNLQNLLFALSEAEGIAGQSGALRVAEETLNSLPRINKSIKIAAPEVDSLGSLLYQIDGGLPYSLLLDAHIDEIGFVVTNVTDSGFLRVAACGGIDLRTLPGTEVTVHGIRPIAGIFCATPPHLAKKEDKLSDISEMAIDIGFPAEEAKKLVHPGNRVNYRISPRALTSGCITGKALDNRAGAAVMLEVARKLSAAEFTFGKIIILLSGQEELGCQGAKTAAYSSGAEEAISVDVSYGTAFCHGKSETGALGGGAMIGIAPTLDRKITDSLIKAAQSAEIPYQIEAMGGKTSTNTDVISVTKSGIPCGLLSVPLRYMHTAAEIIHINDIKSTADIIFEYIKMKGGGEFA